ncbi:MAG: MerR family transcriptional regulator [Thermomicrobia bacterium]|nr:MerR family transcriptional regulator [Thermomicrobia bacterium]
MTCPDAMKVGALAKRTGVSVRTLHYYDEISLLAPSARSEAGYRLYAAADVVRLQQIMSLRQLGFALEQIRDCLNRGNISPLRVIEQQLAQLREQIALHHQLCDRLEVIARSLRRAEEPSVAELLHTMEAMNRMEKYYTPEQREWMKERAQTVGEERIHEVEAEWPELIAAVGREMDAGTDPTDPNVQALARRWMGLVQEFTGGNLGIEKSLRTMYENEKPQDLHPSFDPRMSEYMAYIGKAMAAGKAP